MHDMLKPLCLLQAEVLAVLASLKRQELAAPFDTSLRCDNSSMYPSLPLHSSPLLLFFLIDNRYLNFVMNNQAMRQEEVPKPTRLL